MKIFPFLKDLAEVNEQDLFLQCQGLIYYSRAQRIIKSSKLLIELIGKDKSLDSSMWLFQLDQWIALPGIGRSIGGSIISSALELS